jgi:tellurium resistance protein TerD
MQYWGEDESFIKGECGHCQRVLKIPIGNTSRAATGFSLTTPIKCFCGSIYNEIKGIGDGFKPSLQTKTNSSDNIRCPKCTSTQITAGNKGFGLGKAVVGGLVLGPLGLLGGFMGSKKVMVTCLKCGNKWEAGKA